MTTTKPASGKVSIWRRLYLHSWLGRLGWMCVLAIVTVLTCWVMLRATPQWYRPRDPSDPGVNAEASRADNLYAALHTAVQRVPFGDQTWTITQDELNSSIAVHALIALDPARDPVSDPFVVFSKGSITLSARIKKLPSRDPQGGVGSATFSVGTTTGADGTAMGLVKLQSVHAGILPVPKSFVEPRIRAALPTIITVVDAAMRDQLARTSRSRTGENPDDAVELIMRGISSGEPFPLRVRWLDGKDILIKRFAVEEGSFMVVLGPVNPPPRSGVPLPVDPFPNVPGTLPVQGLRGN